MAFSYIYIMTVIILNDLLYFIFLSVSSSRYLSVYIRIFLSIF